LSAKRKRNAGSFTIRGFKDVDRQKKKECWFGYDPGFPPPAPKRISARTKAALAAAKERGRKLGGIRCRVIRVDESGKKTYGWAGAQRLLEDAGNVRRLGLPQTDG
jgi:hypothetical protein